MTLDQASILIVDDEPVLRMTFAVVLRQLGATVHVAAHGGEALQLLESEHIDLMLTDKHMPFMDGITLLNTLAEKGMSVISVLFVNEVEGETAADLKHWGVVETLTKPVHPVHLVTMLQKVLTRMAAGTKG